MHGTTIESVALWAAFLQGGAVAAAGIWGLFLYRRNRRGQVRVGIETSCRLVRDWAPDRCVLLVKVKLMNTSGVIYYHHEATATLMDARKEALDGTVRLVPFKLADPIPPAYGEIVADPEHIQTGRLFHLEPGAVSLEPGEHLNTELAFILDSEKLGLMALRILFRGKQSRWPSKDYWWGSFLYIDPASIDVGSKSSAQEEQPA